PIGQSYDVYCSCRDQIEQGIASMLKFLEQTTPPPPAKPGEVRSIALGADHGGYELKEMLKAHLKEKGLAVADFGTNSRESADYPEYAQAVARSVAERRHDIGLLVCTTGIGMSIAANKVPGVRAALVWDEQAAQLSRQHNDANVLCLAGKGTLPEQALKIVDAFLGACFEGGRHERRVHKLEP